MKEKKESFEIAMTKTQLREEWKKIADLMVFAKHEDIIYHQADIADWWLSHRDSELTTLAEKVREMKKTAHQTELLMDGEAQHWNQG